MEQVWRMTELCATVDGTQSVVQFIKAVALGSKLARTLRL